MATQRVLRRIIRGGVRKPTETQFNRGPGGTLQAGFKGTRNLAQLVVKAGRHRKAKAFRKTVANAVKRARREGRIPAK